MVIYLLKCGLLGANCSLLEQLSGALEALNSGTAEPHALTGVLSPQLRKGEQPEDLEKYQV